MARSVTRIMSSLRPSWGWSHHQDAVEWTALADHPQSGDVASARPVIVLAFTPPQTGQGLSAVQEVTHDAIDRGPTVGARDEMVLAQLHIVAERQSAQCAGAHAIDE